MRGYLPDVNVLLALAWPNHQFHHAARDWFNHHATQGWSTCALTQLGFIRLSSNPAFTPMARTPQEACLLLAGMVAHKTHSYIAELGACVDQPFQKVIGRVHGHKQATDGYLLSVAMARDLCLVTFDGKLARALRQPNHLLVLS